MSDTHSHAAVNKTSPEGPGGRGRLMEEWKARGGSPGCYYLLVLALLLTHAEKAERKLSPLRSEVIVFRCSETNQKKRKILLIG